MEYWLGIFSRAPFANQKVFPSNLRLQCGRAGCTERSGQLPTMLTRGAVATGIVDVNCRRDEKANPRLEVRRWRLSIPF